MKLCKIALYLLALLTLQSVPLHAQTEQRAREAFAAGDYEAAANLWEMAADRATMCLFLRGDIGVGEDSAVWADRKSGAFTVATPRTCGGFAEHGGFTAGTLSVEIGAPGQCPEHKAAITDGHVSGAPSTGNYSATVWASSLDGKPLAESRRILVSHLTDLRNSGQIESKDIHLPLLDRLDAAAYTSVLKFALKLEENGLITQDQICEYLDISYQEFINLCLTYISKV